MSAESPRHARSGGPLTVPSQPPSDRSIIDAVSGFINDVTLSSSSTVDPKDVIQWARFETADINEPTPEDASENDISPLLLILGYGSGVQVWLIPPTGEAQEVLSWRQGTVRVLRILPTPQHGDCFASKRPLIALCDSASPGPTFCSLSFISIRGGEQVKSIKFKNPILDVLANKRSVVVSFSERFAVFDAGTLEDRMTVTTCYPCPCPLGGSQPINPLALGDRWLAYADKKLNQSKRSSGGCEGEGVTSYTATVLHAAKSLSKGLRGLGETVAHSLAGGRSTSQSPSPPNADIQQPGVITVLDIEGIEEEDGQELEDSYDPIIAHFVAHSDAVIALKFDSSGMLLVTADRRGHDFHVFRINPHPCGSSLAAVHHLYVLHRGDTTAKVQDIAISPDSRWTAISTLRGTTHVFALSPYGGACGVRTHTSPRVVNRLSRFHRSAGLPIHPHAHAHSSGSPVSDSVAQGTWFPNPRLPPYPLPTTVSPLAQLRPTANLPTHTITRTSAGRQRLSSLSEDSNTAPLLARARFGLTPVPVGPSLTRTQPVAALYLMAASGCLSHIALHPRPARNVPKEKICDESPIEVEVEPIAQWPLQRPAAAADLLAPLPPSNPLLQPLSCRRCADMCMSEEERWLSQVEIVTHAGPHRRLWMGPQFVFKTYNCTGSNSSLSEAETVEVDTSTARGVARSNPVNMPGVRPVVPVLIDSGSASECSLEHSPSDSFRRKSLLAETGRAASVCDVQLKEDLAEAMKEDHGWRVESKAARDVEGRVSAGVARVVDPQGTVVAPPPAPQPPPPDDPDSYTSSNADEATFRPVVRAPAALPLHPDMVVRPLPRSTTIPVQTLPPRPQLTPTDEPIPLTTDVFIPAALTSVRGWSTTSQDDLSEVSSGVTVAATDKYEAKDLVVTDKPKLARATPARDYVEETKSVALKDVAAETEKLIDEQKHASVNKSSEQRYTATKSESLIKQKDHIIKIAEVLQQRNIETKVAKPAKQKEANIDKLASRRDVAAKAERNTEQKDTAARIDKSFKEKDSAANLEKYSSQEEGKIEKPAKQSNAKADISVEQKENKLDKQARQKAVHNEPREKTTESNKRVAIDSNLDIINVDIKHPDVNKDLKRQESDVGKRDSVRERRSAERAERECDDFKSLPKSNRSSGDIQPTARIRIKKSPTPKSVSDRDSEVSVKEHKSKKVVEPKEVIEPKEVKETKEIKKQKHVREVKSFKELKEFRAKDEKVSTEDSDSIEILIENKGQPGKKEATFVKDEPAVAVTLKLPSKREPHDTIPKKQEVEIKTEEQAWDLLLSEPEKPSFLNTSQQSTANDKCTEDKPKSRKNRKSKKALDEAQAKADENSFVEIHAIEDKQSCSEDLVSISTPFEDVEPTSSYLSKTKKSRSPKSWTPEKKDDYERKPFDFFTQEEPEPYSSKLKGTKKYGDVCDIDMYSKASPVQTQADLFKDTSNTLKAQKHYDGTASETSSFVMKEPLKPYKSKSLSPYPESRKISEKPIELAEKDVYVINTKDDDFPEIQITRGTKTRKKSPQPVERKSLEKDPGIEKPVVKSWSLIAASKNVKKVEQVENKFEYMRVSDVAKEDELMDEARALDEKPMSSTTVSLQDKLIELCKRTDIMVAECDAPSELNFVEEHHAVLHDLPPLEPLDFGLDDFKLEVMRDSLLEISDTKITSPICKINIDDILCSIKETTSRAIESSVFNLIDLEKIPAKKERGFSVIESHKITTQEVKLDDDVKAEEGEVMEKSSDDDNTSPVVSTDSDKEDKKTAGASNLILPSKQSSKSKKSRRKKK